VKLHAFHATDGDCLLLESDGGRRVLVDGGRAGSFKKCTQPVLDSLAAQRKAIDLVVVSHIDADHISGIIPLLDAVSQWSSFEHRDETREPGDAALNKPKVPKPPAINGIWHNSWRRQLGKLADPAGNLSQAVATAVDIAFGDDRQQAPEIAQSLANLAASMEDGANLMNLIESGAVPVPFNQPFDGMVMLRRPIHVEKLGTLKLSVLGPAQKYIDTLREEFKAVLDTLPEKPKAGRRAGGADGLGQALPLDGMPLDMAVAASKELIQDLAAGADIIEKANANKVTAPNRASIIVLAEERGRTCLLTGDAAEPEILDGLKAAKLLGREPFRCNVLKVQHHGAENNVSADFARQVLAEHYVLCGDGASGNPNPSVVRTIIETRLEADPSRPFTLWFTTSATRPESATKRAVMKEAIGEANRGKRKHPDMVEVRVLGNNEAFHTIDV
jgi:beta-lactamase superfamily II metal-dependent hydrolase